MLDDNWKSIKKFPSDADDTKGQRSPSRPKVAMAESEDMSMKSPQKAMQIGIPPFQSTDKTRSPKWGRLRSLLPSIIHHGGSAPVSPEHSAVVPQAVNIADELVTGGLSTLLLRLWFERDEKGHRRVPVLFHHLHIRVSDSLHPLQRRKTVFRIECEYANGATRWVIYRRLRDFISLHTHYTLSNAFNRNVDKLPEFPRTSMVSSIIVCLRADYRPLGIPYFKFLKKESRDKGDQLPGRVQFARLQREALENYLIDLIRAVVSRSLRFLVLWLIPSQ